MACIEFRNLGHAYGQKPGSKAAQSADYALQPMNMEWRDGGAYALLGPSGCGKSTLLNIISGLLLPSEGQVLFDGQDVTHTPTRGRNIAQVFQFPVLYDSMSVFDNLAFPLRNRKIAEHEVKQRVHEVAEMLDLTPDLKKRASGLAADAKQKISLGRGLVRKDVAAILFDEPLTVIDPHMKWQLRQKLKQIHQQLKLTLIYVTHDQIEALTFADEVVVMTNGKVVQQAQPEALFMQPEHTFVGYFVGSPGMNFLPLRIQGEQILLGDAVLPIAPQQLATLKNLTGALQLGVRPEFVRLAAPGAPGALETQVLRVQNLGTSQLLTAQCGAHVLKARLPLEQSIAPGAHWLQVLTPESLFFCNDIRVGS
ncbi:ABC transporter ATP-binding protein [Massilia sp. W12]|uniref:ABC transporter ATP-binding protein n=1 Tax=Massilia sp. W12 TaxID=3126507 RepID=UPI0030CD7C34